MDTTTTDESPHSMLAREALEDLEANAEKSAQQSVYLRGLPPENEERERNAFSVIALEAFLAGRRTADLERVAAMGAV